MTLKFVVILEDSCWVCNFDMVGVFNMDAGALQSLLGAKSQKLFGGQDASQELVHSLSYVYQKSTTAISVVALICYAHLAASQLGTFMKFEDTSETSSSHGGVTAPGAVPVPHLPRLKENVRNSMFFC
ncbi:hypothetical protein DITRI_Ditri14bG0131700 [Diplodiscus trichospermus]